MRTSLFVILVLTGVAVVAAGWWPILRSRRARRAREVPAAAGKVERHATRGEGAAIADPGRTLRCPPPPPSRAAGPQTDGGRAPGHDDVRLWLGAYVLEALDATDARTVQEHLGGCLGCRAELAEFAVLLELLGRLTAEGVIAGPHAD